MKILVCGDRNWSDYDKVRSTLDTLAMSHSIYFDSDDNWLPMDITIIEGDANGADKMGGQWAITNYARLEVFPAQWDKHGKAAGPIRNQKMLDEGQPDLVVAFHSNLSQSKGTADMVRRAKSANIPVIEVK